MRAAETVRYTIEPPPVAFRRAGGGPGKTGLLRVTIVVVVTHQAGGGLAPLDGSPDRTVVRL